MYTTHGDHIPGTRLGIDPPLKSARCGGVQRCPDCMIEAYAITGLDYYREEHHDEYTQSRVQTALCLAGIDDDLARHAIKVMEDQGILFRERKQ